MVSQMNDMGEILEKIKTHRNKVIVINEQNSKKYKDYCIENNIEIIDFSLKLSELLLPLSDIERENEAWDVVKKWLATLKNSTDIIALDNIDYIFSPEIGNFDPIQNFNYCSRYIPQPIILFIDAKKRGNVLIYSKEGNPDHNEMEVSTNEFVLGWEDED